MLLSLLPLLHKKSKHIIVYFLKHCTPTIVPSQFAGVEGYGFSVAAGLSQVLNDVKVM